MKKIITGLLTFIIIIVCIVLLGKNVIAKMLISTGVKAITGLTLELDKIDVGFSNTAAGITGLKLHNPSDFAEPIMISMPEIYIDYDLNALLKGDIHLEEVRLHLEEFVVVKNEQGQLNLDSLKSVRASQDLKRTAETQKTGKSAPPNIRIDLLALKIDKVVYRDYSQGTPPKVQEFPINIDEQYENVTNPNMLTGLIVSRVFMNTTLAKLTGFNLGALQGQLGEQFMQVQGLVAEQAISQAASQATDTLKGAAESATQAGGEVLGSAGKKLKDTAKSLKGLVPFGE